MGRGKWTNGKTLMAAVVPPAGFMRFDPAGLHFMRVQEVPLAPDGASVGLEIRVIGNDSGEKVGIRLRSGSGVRRVSGVTSVLLTSRVRLSRACSGW